MKCAWHVCTNEVPTSPWKTKKYCSRRCMSKAAVTRRRRLLKKMAVEFLGGQCVKCGYSQCIQALQFHHRSGKEFGISASGHTRSWEALKNELRKCELVCANCHAKTHAEEFGLCIAGV